MHGPDVTLFDRFAPLYERLMPSTESVALREGLGYATRPVERCADIGGGTGRGVRSLVGDGASDGARPAVSEGLVVDPARGMLREVPAPVVAVQGSATDLPLDDDAVDAALVVDALHHMPDHDRVLAEAFRVIRPGGVLVVREFDPATVPGWSLVAVERLVGFDSTFRSPDDLAVRARRAGFRVAVPRRGFDYTLVGVVPRE